MASTQLKNILAFAAVPPAGQATLPHGLNLAGKRLVPDEIKKANAAFSIVSADDVNVTVQNDGLVVANCNVLVEHWHTFERCFGQLFTSDNTNLVPQPFVGDNNIASLVGGVDLQDAYNNTVGSPATITLSPLHGGIVIVGALGVPDPLFQIIDNAGNVAFTVQSAPAGAVVARNLALNDGGTAAFLEGDAGSTAPVSALSTGRIRYNEATNRWQVSENGGAYVNLDGMTTLQEAYDNSTGVPVAIQLAVARGGVRILDVAAQTTPSFEVVSSASVQDSIMVSRTFAGGGIGIDLSMGALTTGNGYSVAMSGTGRPIQITHSAGANSSIRLDRSPGVVTAGAGLDIIYGLNTTGIPITIINSGAGGGISIANTGSGTVIGINNSGSGQVALWTNSGTNATPFSFNNSSNTSGIMVTWTRLPTVATGGTIFRINSNLNFTGIGIEYLMGGSTDSGMNMVMRGSGEGIGLFDQVPNTHTGTALRIQHSITGSTGLLLSLVKLPAAATAGTMVSVSSGSTATGTVMAIAQAGPGIVFDVAHSGPGTTLNIAKTGGGAGINIAETATAGGILLNITRSTDAITNIALITMSPPTLGTAGEGLRVSQNANSAGVEIRTLLGGNAGAIGIRVDTNAASTGILVSDAIGAASTGTGVTLSRNLTGSTGVLLSIQKSPPGATAGNMVSLDMGSGAGATSGHLVNATAGASHTGTFLTLSFLGTGEIWRITAAAGAFRSALRNDGQLRLVNGTAASPAVSFETSPTTGLIRSAADVIGVVTAATERFQFTGAGTGEFIPPADNAGSVGTAARRFTLVRAVTITSGDLAFEDEECPRCKKQFEVDDEIVLKVHKVARDEAKRRVSYSVPMHARCGTAHA